MLHNFQKEALKDFLPPALGNQMAVSNAHKSLTNAVFEKQYTVESQPNFDNDYHTKFQRTPLSNLDLLEQSNLFRTKPLGDDINQNSVHQRQINDQLTLRNQQHELQLSTHQQERGIAYEASLFDVQNTVAAIPHFSFPDTQFSASKENNTNMQQAKYAKHNAKANKCLMKGGFASAFRSNNNGSSSIASLQTISYDNSKETLGLRQDRHPIVGETKKQAKKSKIKTTLDRGVVKGQGAAHSYAIFTKGDPLSNTSKAKSKSLTLSKDDLQNTLSINKSSRRSQLHASQQNDKKLTKFTLFQSSSQKESLLQTKHWQVKAMEELCEDEIMINSELVNKYSAGPSNFQQPTFKRKQNPNLQKTDNIFASMNGNPPENMAFVNNNFEYGNLQQFSKQEAEYMSRLIDFHDSIFFNGNFRNNPYPVLENESISVKKRRLSKSKKELITKPNIEEPKMEKPKVENSKVEKERKTDTETGNANPIFERFEFKTPKAEKTKTKNSKKRESRQKGPGTEEMSATIDLKDYTTPIESNYVSSPLHIHAVESKSALIKDDKNFKVYKKAEKELIEQTMDVKINTANTKKDEHYSQLKETQSEGYLTLTQDEDITLSNDTLMTTEKKQLIPIENVEFSAPYFQDTNNQKEGGVANDLASDKKDSLYTQDINQKDAFNSQDIVQKDTTTTQDIDQKDTFNTQDINKNNEFSSSETTISIPDHIQREIEIINEEFPELKNSYRLLDRIGRGTFSKVYKAEDIHYDKYAPWAQQEDAGGDHLFVAIKLIYGISSPKRVANEISCLQDLKGFSSIVPMITALRNKDATYLVLPYIEYDDFHDIYESMSLLDLKHYMSELFTGLKHVHEKGIIHRDIKPGNFLYNKKRKEGYIGDFGLAQKFTVDDVQTSSTKNGPTRKTQANSRNRRDGYFEHDPRKPIHVDRSGTKSFRAPEIYLHSPRQTTAMDIWAVGVILLSFLANTFPIFNPKDSAEGIIELTEIFGLRKMREFAKFYGRNIKTNLPDMLEEALDMDELCRTLNNDKIVTWDNDDYLLALDLTKKCLQLIDSDRVTASDALEHPFLKGVTSK
ncbi:unnamed protein product [Rhizopus stolonifer]